MAHLGGHLVCDRPPTKRFHQTLALGSGSPLDLSAPRALPHTISNRLGGRGLSVIESVESIESLSPTALKIFSAVRRSGASSGCSWRVRALLASGLASPGNLSQSEVPCLATLPRACCRTNTDTCVGQTLTPFFPKVLQKNQCSSDIVFHATALHSFGLDSIVASTASQRRNVPVRAESTEGNLPTITVTWRHRKMCPTGMLCAPAWGSNFTLGYCFQAWRRPLRPAGD